MELKKQVLMKYAGEGVNDPALLELIQSCQTDEEIMGCAEMYPMPFIMYSLLENPSDKLIRAAMDINPMSFIGIVNPTDEIIDLALSREGHVIKVVPPGRQTHERCVAAINQNPFAIKCIDSPTLDLYQLAYNLNNATLNYMPTAIKPQIQKT